MIPKIVENSCIVCLSFTKLVHDDQLFLYSNSLQISLFWPLGNCPYWPGKGGWGVMRSYISTLLRVRKALLNYSKFVISYWYIFKSWSRKYHFKRNIDENWIVVLKQVFRNCIPLQWTKFWHWVKIFNCIIALHFLDELPGWRCYKQLAADISSPCMSRSLLFTFVAQSLSTCHWDSQFHHQWEYPAHRSTCVQWKENIWRNILRIISVSVTWPESHWPEFEIDR